MLGIKAIDSAQILDKTTIQVLTAAESLMADQVCYMKKALYEQQQADELISKDVKGVVAQLISRGVTGTQKESEMKEMLRMLNESLILKKTFDISRAGTKSALAKMDLQSTDLRLV